MYKVLPVLVTIILLSCSFGDERSDDKITRLVYQVDSVQVLQQNSAMIEMRATATVPNPCYTFDRADVRFSAAGDTIFVSVFAQTDPEVNCIQVLAQIEADVTIPLERPGDYVLRFVGRSKNFDTLLTVPGQ